MSVKAVKLASGNWRCQVYSHTKNGKRKFVSFTHPLKAQAEYMAMEFIAKRQRKAPNDMTVREAIEAYLKLGTTLSPTTLDGYQKVLKNGFKSLIDTKVSKLTETLCQEAINEESKRLSAKTVKNYWGVISCSLKTICKLRFEVRLPKTKRNIKEYPQPQVIYDIVKGTVIELPCLLALWLSFSMSEIYGLMCSDVEDGVITINRVRVLTNKGSVYKEQAKVDTRIRKHKLPQYIKNLIDNLPMYQNYIQTGEDAPLMPISRDHLSKQFRKRMDNAGLDITFHTLRHLNASVMLMLNIPEKYAMERGGWKTPSVMTNVYQHTFSEERKIVDAKVDEYFEQFIK